MMTLQEGSLKFHFAADVQASKYDDWSFYRHQFQNRCAQDNKAVDLIAYHANQGWLIEVKDYRQHSRTKPIDLADEIAIKVRDTLAGLVAASMQANLAQERQFARALLSTTNIRIVCHIEQPAKISRLRPRAIEPDKLQQKLRTLLKAIDPHPIVVDQTSNHAALAWQVQVSHDA